MTAASQVTPTPADREAVQHMLARIARSRASIEQVLDLVDHLADSGNLAAVDGFFRDFNETFNAATRPDLMTMIANVMMVVGALGQIDYDPFFALAMRTPTAVNAEYAKFATREQRLSLREAFDVIRRPEVAGALQLVAAVLRSLRPERDASPSG